jgi:hypothetical protein
VKRDPADERAQRICMPLQQMSVAAGHTHNLVEQGAEMCAQMKVGYPRTGKLAVLALIVALISSCTDGAEQADRPPGTREGSSASSGSTPSAPHTVVRASLAGVNTADLPLLPPSTGMPEAIPPIDAPLPSLLDDLPGRAVVVIRPEIATVNAPVPRWSELDLLFFGVDGRWRRLSMEDLGLSESLTYSDTFGSGALSSDGRWWACPSKHGVIALNLATGETHMVTTQGSSGSLTWVPGRNAILTNGSETTVPGGEVTHLPYSSGSVGHEPDGTPLSVERGSDGQAVLVEWRGSTRRARAVVPSVTAPRRRVTGKTNRRIIAANELTGVDATQGLFAMSERRGRDGLAIVVADSTTGEQIGEMTWGRRDFELFYTAWLDDETLLIATAPWFLGWRPSTGEIFRTTDARSIDEDDCWEISVAQGVLDC